ncbi:MAG: amidohydrolase [Chloroflexi bacterium]|nr:amidohydrolase [Chloroflexota bacterium]
MDIVDAQVHLNRLGSDWEHTPAELIVDYAVVTMDALGLDAVLIDEWAGFDNPVTKRGHLPGRFLPNGAVRGEHPFSEAAIRLHPDRFRYVARIDPIDPDLETLMADVRNKPGALCLRIVPIPEAGELDLYARGGFDTLFASAERHQVPIFAWFPGRSHMLVPTLEKFPNLQLILDHCGVSRTEPHVVDQLDQVFALSKYPNLALKWCHAPSQLSREEYPFRDVIPHLRRAIDAFGPQRVMWASDHTQSKSHHSWAQALYYVLDCAELTEDDKAWILGRSVRTILRWPKPDQGESHEQAVRN